jgi:hypothetical protein
MPLKTEVRLFLGVGEGWDWRAVSLSPAVGATEAETTQDCGGLRSVLTDSSSSVVLDVNEGMVLIEGEGGLAVVICGSCTKDLNASPKGVSETWRVSTIGGAAGRTECLFLRFEIDLASEGREGGSASKGREMS